MKVIQINCVYKKGSTGKLVYDIHNVLLKMGINSIVCYGRGKKEKELNIYKTASEIFSKGRNFLSRYTGKPYGGACLATIKLIKIIKREKPDIVHLHCLNGFFVNIYKLLKFLKISNIKTVLTLHAEFMHTGNCGYSFECDKWLTECGNCPQIKPPYKDKTKLNWIKMKDAFEGFKNIIVVSVSPWLQERAQRSPILSSLKHKTVLNGVNTDIFKLQDCRPLKRDLGILDEKILLHVTANFTNEIKGGKYIIELAECYKDKKIKFILIGNNYKLKLPNNIIDIGRVENQIELAQFYNLADLTILTSKKETFSMICAESLCCGTPIVGFKAGAPEMISIPEYSEFVEYGNVDLLKTCIEKWLKKEIKNDTIINEAKNRYSKEIMSKQYIKLYKELDDQI